MEGQDSLYNAVFHFRDAPLFEAFMADIPPVHLRERLRKSQPLRNRYFPGFRITKSLPTDHQIWIACRKEIVDQKNGNLASFLCALWIREHPSLAMEALSLLGIKTEKPGDANSWIGTIHNLLEADSWETNLRSVARTIAVRHTKEELLIFISIVSYGKDPEYLKRAMEEELNVVATDPNARKGRIQDACDAARAKVHELEDVKVELKSKLDEERRNYQTELDGLTKEHDRLNAEVTTIGKSIDELSSQLERIKEERSNVQKVQESAKKQIKSLTRSIANNKEKLTKQEISIQTQIQSTEENLKAESARVLELDAELRDIQKQVEHATQPPAATAAIGSKPNDRTIDVNATDSSSKAPPKPSTQDLRRSADVLGLGNNAVCYQGIQRTFRNSIVVFLRDRMSRLFPQDHINRIKKLFGEQWTTAELNANQSRDNLGTTTTVRDDYDLLGTNHFYNIFDHFYDKLFIPEAGQPSDLPKPVKARFLGNLKAIKDCRDPLSHPVEEDIPFQEAHHLIYCAQEILKWIGCNEQATELASLAAQLGIVEAEEKSQLRRLPSEDSIYLDFVGRNNLLQNLTECFANPDNKRCLLAGDGGKGKSAAAFRFVQNLPVSVGQYPLILWLSAKKKRFREGVASKIDSPDFTSVEEAVDRLLNEYGATAEDLQKDFVARKRLLFEYLDEFPAFIVADDIDTVLDDNDAVSLFTHEIPHTRSTVLLTSRRSIPGIRTFTVPGFDPSEAEEFIKSRIRLYSLNTAAFTGSVIKKIATSTDGSPLYMDDLLRLAKIIDINKAINMWTEKGGDEARKYALQRETENLSIDARKVLVAAAVQDEPISFAELKDILEFSDDRLLSALIELQTLFLFPKAPAVEGEQRYQINLNTKKLVRLVEQPNEFYTRIETRSKALAGKLPNIQHGLVASLIRQAMLRFNGGLHAEGETILLGAIDRYPNSADLHGVLGFIYRRIGRIADARSQFETSSRLKSTNREMYLHWLKMEIGEREWLRAIGVADHALKVLPDVYEIVERKVYSMRQAGFDLHRGLHYEKAAKMWSEAVDEINKSIKAPESLPAGARALNASMYYTIVVCLDMLSEFRERNRWLERWEREHPDDPQVAIEKEYIIKKRGSLSAGLRYSSRNER